MLIESNPPIVYTPNTVSEMLAYYKKNPESLIYAGGTSIVSKQRGKVLDLGKSVLNISSVNDLKKISRSERYIDFGSCVTLAQVLALRSQIIPKILYKAIESVATPQIRNIATLGGNIAVSNCRMSLYPVFYVLDAKIELKSSASTRWVEIKRFANQQGKLEIRPSEIITRIRVPINEYEFQVSKFSSQRILGEEDYVSCNCVVNFSREVVYRSHILFSYELTKIFKPLQVEGAIDGKKVPFSAKDKLGIFELFEKEFEGEVGEISFSAKQRLRQSFWWLIEEISNFEVQK